MSKQEADKDETHLYLPGVPHPHPPFDVPPRPPIASLWDPWNIFRRDVTGFRETCNQQIIDSGIVKTVTSVL